MSSMYGFDGLRGPTGQIPTRPTGSMLSGARTAPRGYERVQNFTPEQMQIFQQMFSNVGPDSFLSRLAGGDQDIFNQIEAPALQQFSGLQGNLASRFSGMGGLGARRSSGFQNTANQAASDFALQLQGQRQALQQQALRDLANMSSDLLEKKPFSYMQKGRSFLQELLTGLAGGIGSIGGNSGNNYFMKLMGL